MLVYRSFVVGMLGAIALLVASLPAELEERRVRAEEAEAPAVINVSRSALAASPDPGAALADLMVLTAGEEVVFVVTP